MKELIRFAGYTVATLAMIFVLIEVAQSGVSGETFAYSAIFVVIILPLIIGYIIVKKEKRDEQKQE